MNSNICNYDPMINLSLRGINQRFHHIHRYLCYLVQGGAGPITAANNGTSLSGSAVTLGQELNEPGDPAQLTNRREIPIDDYSVSFTNDDVNITLGTGPIAPGIVAMQVEATGGDIGLYGTIIEVVSTANTTETVGSDIESSNDGDGTTIGLRTTVQNLNVAAAGSTTGYTAIISNSGSGSAIGIDMTIANGGTGSASGLLINASGEDFSQGFNILSTSITNQAIGGLITATGDSAASGLNITTNATGDTTGLTITCSGNGTNIGVLVDVSSGSSNYAALLIGDVGVRTLTPTAYLHLAAGTATVNTAPLKFTAGTNLGTPENGAMEFDGSNLYITIGGVRRTINVT